MIYYITVFYLMLMVIFMKGDKWTGEVFFRFIPFILIIGLIFEKFDITLS